MFFPENELDYKNYWQSVIIILVRRIKQEAKLSLESFIIIIRFWVFFKLRDLKIALNM